MGTGPLHRPKLPGIPGIETFRGPLVPHEPVGLRLHRRRPDRRADGQARRQARRHHRHRRHRGAVHPAPGRGVRGSCTCSSARRRRSTCATTARSTRSGSRRSSPAGSSGGWRTSPPTRPAAVADEDLVQDGWTDIARRIRDRIVALPPRTVTPERRCSRPSRTPTSRRWRRSAPASTPIVADPETAADAQGLVPPAVQAAVLPRRVPAGLQRARAPTSSTPTARASSASPRPGWSSPAREYELDCIIYALRLRGRHRPHAAAPAST